MFQASRRPKSPAPAITTVRVLRPCCRSQRKPKKTCRRRATRAAGTITIQVRSTLREKSHRGLGHVTQHQRMATITRIQAQKDPAHQARQVGAAPGLVQIGGPKDHNGQQEGRQPQDLED